MCSCVVDFASCKKYTESYRGVPSSYVPPRCSGRTDLCNEVSTSDYLIDQSYLSFVSGPGCYIVLYSTTADKTKQRKTVLSCQWCEQNTLQVTDFQDRSKQFRQSSCLVANSVHTANIDKIRPVSYTHLTLPTKRIV